MFPDSTRSRLRLFFAAAVLCMAFAACESTAPTGPLGNERPRTYIAYDTVNTVLTSRVRVAWYGDDPDGFVRGFLYSWDERTWHFTSRNDSTFFLALRGLDTVYTFTVIAVDNSAVSLPAPDAATVAFDDANGNGRHDDGEEFAGLRGATDGTAARLRFPISNSPPVVFFGDDSTATARRAVELPDTTFTVATFRWSGFDIDGDATIVRYEWSLNDSAASATWRALPATTRSLTLREADGIRPDAGNRFHLRAVDAAGAVSAVVSMPGEGRTWYARKPRGPILIVRDYTFSDGAAAFYAAAFDSLDGGRFKGRHDELDIRRGAEGGTYGELVPPIIDPMLIETFKLFNVVLWYGDGTPTLSLARLVLPAYARAGGKVIFTTSLPNAIDPVGELIDFAPLDSAATLELQSSVTTGTAFNALALADGAYPALVKGAGTMFIHPLYPNIAAQPLYRLPASVQPGEPIVAVRSGARNFIYLAFQLHKISQPGAGEFLRRAVVQDFGQ